MIEIVHLLNVSCDIFILNRAVNCWTLEELKKAVVMEELK